MTTVAAPTGAQAKCGPRDYSQSKCAAAPFSHILPAREAVRKPSSLFSPNSVKLPKVTTTCNKSFCARSSMSIDEEQGLGREENGSVPGEKDAVVIVDHGSKHEFVAMFKGRTGYHIVEPAHMELAEPSIRDAFKLCVQQGANRIIVSPFFLFPGRHWHQDIPSLAAEAAKENPGISYIVSAPLGLHELMVDVMNDRIKQCLSHVAGNADECNVCAGTGRCREYELS